MKKLMGILLTVLLLAFCVSALAEADILAIEAANATLAVHDVYPSVAQRIAYYDLETGEITEKYDFYMTKGREDGIVITFVYADGNMQSYGDGGGYGYLAESKQPYVCGFVANAYEEYMEQFVNQNLGEFAEGQVITSEATLADGKLLVVTEGEITADNPDYGQAFAGSTLVVRYMLNPENLIIERFEAYIRGEDKAERLYLSSTVERDPVYSLPFDDSVIRNPAALRDIHVIMDPGAETETEYVINAPLNLLSSLYAPDGYAFYDDAACTVPTTSLVADAEGNYPPSCTLYCGPEKE